ncbi:MAG TPA: trigger factor [Candidatus Ozemobacteraceae bacterium]|nr:trigger factor [Candidatus Ozemobacteraceae bacterium]
MLKTQVQELEPNKVALSVEVGKEKVVAAYESFFLRAANSVKIPGFRKGKVPRKIIENHLGKEAIREQVEEELVDEMYPVAVRDAKLHPVSRAKIEDVQLKEGESFAFKAIIEIRPKLPEFSYTGREVTAQRIKLEEAGVDKVLEKLREQFSRTVPVENGTLDINDYFTVTCEVKVDGEVDKDLSEEKGYHRLIEANRLFLPLKGCKAGDQKTYQVPFTSEGDKGSKYEGKTLEITATLENVSRPMKPELNDEFAKEVGEYQNLEALKAKIREDLEQQLLTDAEDRAYDAILKQVSDETTFAIPESMVQRTIDFFLHSIDRRWRQYNTSLEEVLKRSNKDIKEYREGFREKAVYETRVMLITDSIAERQHIEVTDAEFMAEVERQAKEYGYPVEKLLEMFKQSDGEDNVRHTLLNRKIREFLLKNNQIHYDMVSEADFNKGESDSDAGTHSS